MIFYQKKVRLAFNKNWRALQRAMVPDHLRNAAPGSQEYALLVPGNKSY